MKSTRSGGFGSDAADAAPSGTQIVVAITIGSSRRITA
jgi:hypothetical protein